MCLLPPKALVTISNTCASLTTPRSLKAPATARKDAPLVTSAYAPLGYPAGAENIKTKIKYATPDHAIALMATFSNMSRSRYHLAIPWYCLWNVGKCLIQSILLYRKIAWRGRAAARHALQGRRFDRRVGEVPYARQLLGGHAHRALVVRDIKVRAVLVPEKHFFSYHSGADASPVLPRVVKNRLAAGNVEPVAGLTAERAPQEHQVVDAGQVELGRFFDDIHGAESAVKHLLAERVLYELNFVAFALIHQHASALCRALLRVFVFDKPLGALYRPLCNFFDFIFRVLLPMVAGVKAVPFVLFARLHHYLYPQIFVRLDRSKKLKNVRKRVDSDLRRVGVFVQGVVQIGFNRERLGLGLFVLGAPQVVRIRAVRHLVDIVFGDLGNLCLGELSVQPRLDGLLPRLAQMDIKTDPPLVAHQLQRGNAAVLPLPYALEERRLAAAVPHGG